MRINMSNAQSPSSDVVVYPIQDPQNQVSKDTLGYVRIQRNQNTQDTIYNVRVHLFIPELDSDDNDAKSLIDDRNLVCLKGYLYIPANKPFHTDVEYTIQHVSLPDDDGETFMVLRLKGNGITEYVNMQIIENTRYDHIKLSKHQEFLKLPIDLDDE